MLLGEALSFVFGVLSNILWFVILIPQVYTNYKLKNSDAFSFNLVLMWIFGDIFSIISSNAKSLPMIITYSALYHMILASVFMGQILYYRHYNLNKRVELNNENEILIEHQEQIVDILDIVDIDTESPEISREDSFCYSAVESIDSDEMFNEPLYRISEVVPITHGVTRAVRNNNSVEYDNILLLSNQEQVYISLFTFFTVLFIVSLIRLDNYEKIALADLIGWIATFIFISSRVPQIYLNYKRGSVEGLSLNSFILINVANYLFITSILVNLIDISDASDKFIFILSNIQWIMGSFCTSFFDGIIFYQFIRYK